MRVGRYDLVMSLTNLNQRARHALFRAVLVVLRFVLPVVIGIALLLGGTRFVLGAGPAVRTGGHVPAGYMQVDGDGWNMTVPASWESDPPFKPDSPDTVVHLFASSRVTVPGPESWPEYRARDAYLSVVVSRMSRDLIDLDSVVDSEDLCYQCPPDLRRDRHVVDVHGRWGVLTDVTRADGTRKWSLVVQNDCYVYVADAKVVASRVGDMSEAVERVLASGAIKNSGKHLGRCWG